MRSFKTCLFAIAALGGVAFAAQDMMFLPEPAASKASPNLYVSQDGAFGTPQGTPAGRYDRNADGRVDFIVADRNGDGKADYWATDRNFDGTIDDYQYDRNFDGRIDQWEYDMNGDGVSDKIYVDIDADSRPDMYANLNSDGKTYTWYGNLSGVQAAGGLSKSHKSPRRLASGKAANSY